MSARPTLLFIGVRALALAVATGCAAVVEESGPGTTLPPLRPTNLDRTTGIPTATAPVDAGDPNPAPTSTMPTMPTSTPTTSTPTTTAASTSTTSTPATTIGSTVATTVASSAGLVNGVSATIAGRSLPFSSACRDGQNVVLDGVTWSFAGNSFRFDATAADDRSAAVLIGDGFTMPMLVSSVQNGVYTYVGSPVANSVSSATVEVDHRALPSC